METSELKKILQDHPSLEFISDKSKVRCSLTKHEMPATVAAIQSYVNGKKYKKVRAEKCYDYDKLKPHIVSSTKKKHLHELFCTLTLRHIGKSPEDVERHLSGRKYKRALARWQKCKETGERFVPRPARQKKVMTSDSDSLSGGDQFWLDDSGEDEGSEDDMSDLYPAEEFKEDEAGEINGECNKEETTENATEADIASDSDYSLSELDQNGIDKAAQPKSKSLKSDRRTDKAAKSSSIKSDNSTNNKPEKQDKGKQKKRQSSTENKTVNNVKKKKVN